MPIYEYECSHCGKRLEVLQKISDPPETQCPECRNESLQKLVSAAGFRLKGTGWYVTDFKNKSEAKPGSTKDAKGSTDSAETGKASGGDGATAKEQPKTSGGSESASGTSSSTAKSSAGTASSD